MRRNRSGMYVVGYAYQADISCTADQCPVGKAATAAVGSATGTTEERLDAWAAQEGIDRTREEAWDSSRFPKVILANTEDANDRCSGCGDVLQS